MTTMSAFKLTKKKGQDRKVNSFCRLQHQLMHAGSGHRLLRKWKVESGAAKPRRPLVHVVGTEKIAGLTGDDIKGGVIEVCQIHGGALGRTKVAADRFDGVAEIGRAHV